MAIELKGKLIAVLEEQAVGNGKKKEFVIETPGEYPKKAAFELWNDKISMLDGLGVGSELNVSFNYESREYNGRWYSNGRAWKVEVINRVGSVTQEATPPSYTAGAPAEAATAPDSDDLPF